MHFISSLRIDVFFQESTKSCLLIFVEPSTLVEKARLSNLTFRRRRCRRRRRRPQIFTLWLKFLKF